MHSARHSALVVVIVRDVYTHMANINVFFVAGVQCSVAFPVGLPLSHDVRCPLDMWQSVSVEMFDVSSHQFTSQCIIMNFFFFFIFLFSGKSCFPPGLLLGQSQWDLRRTTADRAVGSARTTTSIVLQRSMRSCGELTFLRFPRLFVCSP